MRYVNGGVHGLRSKKGLKDAVKADPSAVVFYCTAMYGDKYDGPVSAMPENTTLMVVGPDPFHDRRWYASVERTAKGFKVS